LRHPSNQGINPNPNAPTPQKVGDLVTAAAKKIKQQQQPEGATSKDLGGLLGAVAGLALEAALDAVNTRMDAQAQAGGGGGGGGGGEFNPYEALQTITIPVSALPSAGVKPAADEQLPPGVGLLISGCVLGGWGLGVGQGAVMTIMCVCFTACRVACLPTTTDLPRPKRTLIHNTPIIYNPYNPL